MGYAIGGLILGYVAENLSVIISVYTTAIFTLIVSILFMVFYKDVSDNNSTVDLTQYKGGVKIEDASTNKESFE